jgi:AcrR family transcriptional regulator
MPATTKAAPRRTQRERTEATTSQLIAVARDLFAREGYAGTSLEAVVSECGVTKGALYHHFSGKADLFEAVFIEEERRLCKALAAAYAGKRDPMQGVLAGFRAWLEACLDPGVQRITLLDAPSVLGWARMREIEAEFGLALIKQGMREAMDAGQVRRRDVDPLSHLLFGALCEGAMYIARADDPARARRKFDRELKGLLDALAS